MKTKRIEGEIDIFCAKKHVNQEVIFVLLDPKLHPKERLLCQLCIEELDQTHSKLRSFKTVKDDIQKEQDILYEDFNKMIKSTLSKVDLFKQIVNKLKSDMMKKIDELLVGSNNWINSCLKMGKQSAEYSFIDQLGRIEQSIEEKQRQQIIKINQLNYSQYCVISQTLMNNTFFSDFFKCQNVLRKVFIQEYHQKLENKNIGLENIEQNNTIELDLQCAQHQKKVISVDLTKGVQKNNRMKCTFCNQDNFISLQDFYLKWQAYSIYKINCVQKLRNHQIERMSKVYQVLSLDFVTQYHQMIQLMQQIDQTSTQYELWQQPDPRLAKSEIQNESFAKMAEELSEFEADKQIEDVKLFHKHTEMFNQSFLTKMQEMMQSLQQATCKIEIQLSQVIEDQYDVKTIESDQIDITTPMPDEKITYKLIDDKQLQSEYSYALAFNYNSSLLVATCGEKIQVWSFLNGELQNKLAILSKHTGDIYCLVSSKKINWFASGGQDSAIICWKEQGKDGWTNSKPEKKHTQSVLCLVLNQNEDQLISCSCDTSIKIWRVDLENNQLSFAYSLDRHTNRVGQICLNEVENQLVSCGLDRQILIWGKNKNDIWEYMYKIDKSINDYGWRVCFMDDNTISWPQWSSGYTHFFQFEKGQFKEKPELALRLKKQYDKKTSLFPATYNKQRRVLIQKHNRFIYIIRQQLNGTFQIEGEPIDGRSSFNFGALTEDGQHLVNWNDKTNQFRVYELKYE